MRSHWILILFGGIMGYLNSLSAMSSCPIIWCGAWSLLRHGSRNSNQPPITVTMWWPQGMLEDIVVSVSAIGWKDSFFRDGHTSRSLDIFGHIFTQFSPWDPLWICAALMYPNTVKFSINSLENRWKKSKFTEFPVKFCPVQAAPVSHPASTERSRLPGPWRSQLSRLSSPRANRIRSLVLCLRPKGPRDWGR